MTLQCQKEQQHQHKMHSESHSALFVSPNTTTTKLPPITFSSPSSSSSSFDLLPFQEGRTPLHLSAFLPDNGQIYRQLVEAGAMTTATDMVSFIFCLNSALSHYHLFIGLFIDCHACK